MVAPAFPVYGASKAGLIGFTQSLAWELATKGIRVVAVAPGLVHTPMIHKHAAHLTPEIWAKIEACHPLGMGRPDDVAAAVAFLASSDARWITGITLPLGWAYHYPLPTEGIDGGMKEKRVTDHESTNNMLHLVILIIRPHSFTYVSKKPRQPMKIAVRLDIADDGDERFRDRSASRTARSEAGAGR